MPEQEAEARRLALKVADDLDENAYRGAPPVKHATAIREVVAALAKAEQEREKLEARLESEIARAEARLERAVAAEQERDDLRRQRDQKNEDIDAMLTKFLDSETRCAALEARERELLEALEEIRDRGPDKSSSNQWASFPQWAKERASNALEAGDGSA